LPALKSWKRTLTHDSSFCVWFVYLLLSADDNSVHGTRIRCCYIRSCSRRTCRFGRLFPMSVMFLQFERLKSFIVYGFVPMSLDGSAVCIVLKLQSFCALYNFWTGLYGMGVKVLKLLCRSSGKLFCLKITIIRKTDEQGSWQGAPQLLRHRHRQGKSWERRQTAVVATSRPQGARCGTSSSKPCSYRNWRLICVIGVLRLTVSSHALEIDYSFLFH
jgi:hypothetical protein